MDGDVSCEKKLFHKQNIEQLLFHVLRQTGKTSAIPAQVNIVIMCDAVIAGYNHAYRQKNRATNVLAFPTVEKNQPWPVLPNHPILLGDILIGWETVVKEALEQHKILEHHVMHLLVHGFLHLLHYDHENDSEAQEMEGLERAIFQSMGWPDPYAGEIQEDFAPLEAEGVWE